MSRRLEELNSKWESLQEHIRQFPHLPSDHPLIEAASEGSRAAKKYLEDEIREEYAVEFEWEEFMEEAQKDNALLSLPFGHLFEKRLKFSVEQLGVDQLEFLLQQSKNLPGDGTFSRDVKLESRNAADLTDAGIPLFAKFLNQFGAKHVNFRIDVLSEEDGNATVSYTISVEDSVALCPIAFKCLQTAYKSFMELTG